jgi:hypothetical protein
MGFAHGQIMKDEITALLFNDLPFFYRIGELNKAVDNEYLPQDMRDMLVNAKYDEVPEVMLKVLTWVWDTQYPYFKTESLVEEIDAIADGYCDGDDKCDVDRVRYVIRAQNLFPELVRMSCTIVSSWEAANKPGHQLPIQLRALDFGNGPFTKNQALIVRHPTGAQPFASLFFPGAVGVVTAASPTLAQAEKVWMSHDGRSEHPRVEQLRSVGLDMAPNMKGLRPGTYDGISDIFAIRSIMEKAKLPSDAVAMAAGFKRTWPVFLGFTGPTGSAILAYEPEAVHFIDDRNNDEWSGTEVLKNVVYLDRHVQPSTGKPELYEALKDQHGQLTGEWIVQNIPAMTKTGDVHIMLVDWNTNNMFISVGYAPNFMFDDDGYAYARPFLRFDMDRLWGETKP